MKIKSPLLFLIFLSFQGCSTIPAAPTLERAVKFEKGISRIPEDHYLFLEFSSSSVCSEKCNCAAVAPVALLYEITSTGDLWIERDPGFTSTGESVIETAPNGLSSLSVPIIGFFVFNDWGGQVNVVDALPYTLAPGDSTIAAVYSVDADGTAVVDLFGETVHQTGSGMGR
jgi:hypothetical protein